ncbi:amino acid ABC transporter permease [Fructobacillus sp. M1-13]|uniref:Amino acid ABC transporter permease n=1 Tax=Fructobacillus papyriferae TaxID=2713171 RepID=A0ABS5QPW6_9LACO|nr:amino acid ABC transporter permease [Fructobacillus papyriferae]MBS9335224.1 amino acid ABC transporter permease [Fructobacillus papyriferae]MCD2159107.1 amino acid ABC transporter permease [Fructobacillus papyriferae]
MTLFNHYSALFFSGFGYTILASLIALVASLILGTFFALLQLSKKRFLAMLGNAYVQFLRNVPLLIITLFFYLAVAKVIKMTGFVSGTVALSLYTSAFIAESVRAGILAIDHGQMEGALANGLSYGQAMSRVVLPQAFKVALPSLGNQLINLVKNSSILAFVGGLDLMYQGNLVAASSFDTFTSYLVVGLFYLVLTLPLSYVMQYLEEHLQESR